MSLAATISSKISVKNAMSVKKSGNSKKFPSFKNPIVKIQAYCQANKITRALNEVEKIEKGKRAAKSFDDFLDEL